MEDIFTMRLEKTFFDALRSGEKIYEIRVNDAKRRTLEVGNLITFISRENEQDTFTCTVEQLLYFDSFVDLFSSLRKEDCGFSQKQTADEIEDMFLQYYTAKELAKDGLVAIKVRKI